MIKMNAFAWYQSRFLMNWVLYEIHVFFILQIMNKHHSYIFAISNIIKIPPWIFSAGLIEFHLFLAFWRINTFICHILILKWNFNLLCLVVLDKALTSLRLRSYLLFKMHFSKSIMSLKKKEKVSSFVSFPTIFLIKPQR